MSSAITEQLVGPVVSARPTGICHFCHQQVEIEICDSHLHNQPGGRCNLPICKNMACRLLHLYQNHPQYISEINRLEDMLKSMTVHIVVAPVRHKLPIFDGCIKAGFIIPTPVDDKLCQWSPIVLTRSREKTTERLEELLTQPFYIERKVHQIPDILPSIYILKTRLIEYGITVSPVSDIVMPV